MNTEIILDSFAGGGGASTGIELALGRSPDLAINHDAEAIAMHAANHPTTVHHCESVWDVDPVKACAGRPLGLAWFSPDCKHFSKAKGGKPREKRIRGLAWVVLRWVNAVRPRVIVLENVEEFQTWGPLTADGHPCKGRWRGWFFRCFTGALRRRAYAVEWRELRACDYGAPTIRKRLILIARCDGQPIAWPVATHGAPTSPAVRVGALLPWRTAAECIDWSRPCPSIFGRKRPLADATCRRIAKGIMRYVINCADPFIVPLTHHDASDRVTTMRQPVPTVTGANRGEMALVAPTVMTNTTGHAGSRINEPLKTVATGGHHALVAPVLTEHANATHGRTFSADSPLRTQCAEVKGGHFALVSAFLAKHYGGVVGSKLTNAIGTVTATDHHSLVTGCLIPRYGERAGQEPRARDVQAPMPTVVPTQNGGSLVAATLARQFGTSTAANIAAPAPTVMADGGGKTQLVQAFLLKYYGNEKEALDLCGPLHTVTAIDRFGLVTVNGEEYAIADIGLRMLAPRELFRAQGFPESYIIGDDAARGLVLTKSAQVRMCGNSVCPPLAAALVAANCPDLARKESAA